MPRSAASPQGGVVSPVLSNIYLHKLDNFVENTLIPQYTRGDKRARNPEYEKTRHALARARRGRSGKVRSCARGWRACRAWIPTTRVTVGCGMCAMRRHLLGFTGPKAEAEQIKQRLAEFLRDDLHLELSDGKTLITHARTGAARFLGYEITTQHAGTSGRNSINGGIALRVPKSVIKSMCRPYLQRGKPAPQRALCHLDDYDIVKAYGAIYRGVVQYYLLAGDVHRLDRLRWIMETSLLKTLAAKHHSTVAKMAARYKANIETPHGPRTCFEAVRTRGDNRKPLVARFGGIPLKRHAPRSSPTAPPAGDPTAQGTDHPTPAEPVRTVRRQRPGAVHHVARLADLAPPGPGRPTWANLMAKKRRKTLVVCTPCHEVSTPTGHHRDHGISHQRAGCSENEHVRFGGRPHGKGPVNLRAPRRAAYPTQRCDPGVPAPLRSGRPALVARSRGLADGAGCCRHGQVCRIRRAEPGRAGSAGPSVGVRGARPRWATADRLGRGLPGRGGAGRSRHTPRTDPRPPASTPTRPAAGRGPEVG